MANWYCQDPNCSTYGTPQRLNGLLIQPPCGACKKPMSQDPVARNQTTVSGDDDDDDINDDDVDDNNNNNNNNNSSSSKYTSYSDTDLAGSIEIHHIDVGQGDATLIYVRDTEGVAVFSVLIDTGRTGKEVASYLDALKKDDDFRPLDAFVVSHYDADHIGGAEIVLTKDRIQSEAVFYDLGDPESPSTPFENYSRLKIVRGRRTVFSLREPIFWNLGVRLRCLAYNGLMEPYNRMPNYFWSILAGDDVQNMNLGPYFPAGSNERSAALLLEFGTFYYFTAGDLCDYYEEEVAHFMSFYVGPNPHVCAWKLGHHGANEATTQILLEELRPRLGVISCGTNNGYGHPAQGTIDRLEAQRVECTYLATAKVVPAHGNGFEIGQIGNKGRDNQGTIVITVSAEQAANHKFSVTSGGREPEELSCGNRPYVKPVNIKQVKHRAKRAREDDSTKDASRKRQKDRLEHLVAPMRDILRNKVQSGESLNDAVDDVLMKIAKRYNNKYEDKAIDAKNATTYLKEKTNGISFPDLARLLDFLGSL